MLQKVGDFFKRGKVAAVTVALISAALMITGKGLSDQFTLPGGSAYAAEGDDVQLDPNRAREALRLEQERLGAEGANLGDPAVLDKAKDRALERLIVTELLNLRTADQGYRVSAARVEEAIRGEPAFQVDGRYNETLALSRLAQIGATPEGYRLDVRDNLQRQELSRAIGLGEFMTTIEVGRRLALEGQQRELRYAILPASRFTSAVRTNDQEIAAWYSKNGSRFATPESVSIDFISVSESALRGEIVVSEDDLRAAYASRAEEFQQPERRRLRHILLDSEPAARAVLRQLQAGADFANLARKSSKDTGSSANGGDLGLSARDAFVKTFADAAFSLGAGAISEPVKTEFGYHVIRVEEIQPAQTRAFESVSEVLREALLRERAAQRLADVGERMEQRIGQASSDLRSLAKDFNLPLRSAVNFTRAGDPTLSTDREFTALVFGDEHLVQRRIGGPLELGDGLVVFQVVDHQKSVIPSLDTVRDKVVAAYVGEETLRLARVEADRLAGRLSGGSAESLQGLSGVAFSGPNFVTRSEAETPAAVRQAAFALRRPAASAMVAAGVSVPEGAAIVVVSGVRPAPPADPTIRGLRLQGLQLDQGQVSLSAYVSDLRRRADVRKNPEAF